ncbi:MAG TPA: PIG-L family deacetylase [Myxococcota bacterium]|nr:PIG-L family deacetylase [Myxococcota bacterium]HRY97160.1 PIG-L family deacetylase [Myxococcota bacterium]HSA20701.1 PIG-L family deacetylase [Myxococcota bacterium]
MLDPDLQDLIVLSPHLDDAALSVGGLIHRVCRAGGRALVATFCTGQPAPEQVPPGLAHFADLPTRRAEDARALARLGAEPRWLGFVDRIFRAPRLPLAALMTLAPPDEPGLLDQLAPMRSAIEGLLTERPRARCLCPLAIGLHRDHQAVWQAGLQVLRARAAAARFAFYEDVYAWLDPRAERPAEPGLALAPASAPLGPEDGRAQLEAVGEYASQLPALGGLARLGRLLAERRAALGGAERLWEVA